MASIGLIDSGLGGLTVLRQVFKQMPMLNTEYFGDCMNNPYGPKDKDEIIQFVRQILSFLSEKNIKLAILACNTATAAALDIVKTEFDFPILGIIEPGARAALKATENKKIGVIGTEFTIKSKAYEKAIKSLDDETKIISQACPPFCNLVEAGKISGKKVEDTVQKYISKYSKTKIDTLVLGCTHYPVLAPVIKKFLSPDITIVDPAVEVIAETKLLLKDKIDHNTKKIYHNFYTSGKTSSFSSLGEPILGRPIRSVKEVIM